MSEATNREIRLRNRPEGMPSEDDFELAEVPVPKPADGQFLVRNIWMSVDPYMRGRMRDRPSYIEPFRLGAPLEGGCVGRVVESNHADFPVGADVLGRFGWRDYWVSDGKGVDRIDPTVGPLPAYLGALGMPGLTAYAGLLRVGEVREGETVFVSSASGAVGSVVCQIARIKGCRVIGSAGSDEKVAWLRERARVDHAVNYRRVDDLPAELRRIAPDGIDFYYDNVGGEHLEAAIEALKTHGRIACCGMISMYNEPSPPPGPANLFQLIVKRLRMQGFLVFDHQDLRENFYADMKRWIADGKLTWKETVLEGLENAPRAFLGLFRGESFGKMLVRIGPDRDE